ncbi:DUF3574 domain-containing protein [Pantoea sp.]|uniref:DUF3574 domain-containing protein n=1 Tax=Pantoea sp. TaxID=69393 RepID=UPI0028A1F588|nr:DUF3574 domain-containing protein [Pantoea sp.]
MKNLTCVPLMLALLLSGCKTPSSPPPTTRVQPVCAGGEMMMQTTLWFGISRSQGAAVSAVDWQNFVDKEVTPRFNAGFSVYEAQGQWMGREGRLTKENSKALVVIHGIEDDSNNHIEALRSLYKERFAQESVMRVDTPACVGF